MRSSRKDFDTKNNVGYFGKQDYWGETGEETLNNETQSSQIFSSFKCELAPDIVDKIIANQRKGGSGNHKIFSNKTLQDLMTKPLTHSQNEKRSSQRT